MFLLSANGEHFVNARVESTMTTEIGDGFVLDLSYHTDSMLVFFGDSLTNLPISQGWLSCDSIKILD